MLLLYITTFSFIVFITAAKKDSFINNKYNTTAILALLFILISISIYNVDLESISDLRRYNSHFFYYQGVSLNNIELRNEPLFSLLQWLIANAAGSFRFFLVIVWTVIFTNFIKALKNLFPKSDVLFVFASFVTFFIFFNYVLNVMRQGLAISFLILAMSVLITKKNKSTFYISIIFAPLFHITSLPLSIILLVYKRFNIKLRTITIVWLLSIVLFLTNLNGRLFSFLPIDQLEVYSSEQVLTQYSSVNRIDFLTFSVFFALLGYLTWRYILNKQADVYKSILKFYLIFNTFFILLGFIAYSDRLAAYSWMLIPILIWKGISETENFRYKAVALLLSFIIIGIFTGSINAIL